MTGLVSPDPAKTGFDASGLWVVYASDVIAGMCILWAVCIGIAWYMQEHKRRKRNGT